MAITPSITPSIARFSRYRPKCCTTWQTGRLTWASRTSRRCSLCQSSSFSRSNGVGGEGRGRGVKGWGRGRQARCGVGLKDGVTLVLYFPFMHCAFTICTFMSCTSIINCTFTFFVLSRYASDIVATFSFLLSRGIIYTLPFRSYCFVLSCHLYMVSGAIYVTCH